MPALKQKIREQKIFELANKRGEWLLAIAAFIGLAFAAFGLQPTLTSQYPFDGVAKINGYTITQAEYEAVKGKVADVLPAGTLTKSSQHKQLLDAMIEEHLLAQRALVLGLGLSDVRLRKMLAASLAEWQANDTASEEVDDASLRQFFDDNAALFQPPDKMQIKRLKFKCIDAPCNQASSAYKRAKMSYHKLSQGDKFITVQKKYADKEILSLPNQAISLKELHHLLGKTITNLAVTLAEGEISQPFISAGSYHIVVSIKHVSSNHITFDSQKDSVLKEYNKRKQLTALRAYIKQLKTESSIDINEEYFQGVEKLASTTRSKAVQ